MLALLIALLSALGLLISVYFVAVYYGWTEANTKWVPRVCQMDPKTCARIVFTRAGSLIGVPNALPGMVFYGALLVADVTGLLFVSPFYDILLAACSLALIVGLYLTYWLLFIGRATCTLCLASHGINLALLILILLGRAA